MSIAKGAKCKSAYRKSQYYQDIQNRRSAMMHTGNVNCNGNHKNHCLQQSKQIAKMLLPIILTEKADFDDAYKQPMCLPTLLIAVVQTKVVK